MLPKKIRYRLQNQTPPLKMYTCEPNPVFKNRVFFCSIFRVLFSSGFSKALNRYEARFRTGHLLLSAHLEDLAVAVGVDVAEEGGAAGGAVFRQEAAGFVTDSAGVAEGFGPVRPGPPLGGLLNEAMAAAALGLQLGVVGSRRRSFLLLFGLFPRRFSEEVEKVLALGGIGEDETGRG